MLAKVPGHTMALVKVEAEYEENAVSFPSGGVPMRGVNAEKTGVFHGLNADA